VHDAILEVNTAAYHHRLLRHTSSQHTQQHYIHQHTNTHATECNKVALNVNYLIFKDIFFWGGAATNWKFDLLLVSVVY